MGHVFNCVRWPVLLSPFLYDVIIRLIFDGDIFGKREILVYSLCIVAVVCLRHESFSCFLKRSIWLGIEQVSLTTHKTATFTINFALLMIAFVAFVGFHRFLSVSFSYKLKFSLVERVSLHCDHSSYWFLRLLRLTLSTSIDRGIRAIKFAKILLEEGLVSQFRLSPLIIGFFQYLCIRAWVLKSLAFFI